MFNLLFSNSNSNNIIDLIDKIRGINSTYYSEPDLPKWPSSI